MDFIVEPSFIDRVAEEAEEQLQQEKFDGAVEEYKKLAKNIKEAKLNLVQHKNRMELFLAEDQYFSDGDIMESSSLNCIRLDMRDLK